VNTKKKIVSEQVNDGLVVSVLLTVWTPAFAGVTDERQRVSEKATADSWIGESSICRESTITAARRSLAHKFPLLREDGSGERQKRALNMSEAQQRQHAVDAERGLRRRSHLPSTRGDEHSEPWRKRSMSLPR